MRKVLIYSKDKSDLNLSKAYFYAMYNLNKELNIKDIYFNEDEGILQNDFILSYNQLKNLNCTFKVVNTKKNTGYNKYKTFKGLMTRLYEETRNYKNKLK